MPTRIRNLVTSGIWTFDLAALCLGAFLMAGMVNGLIAGSLRSPPALEAIDLSDIPTTGPPPSNKVIVERNYFGSALAIPKPPEPEPPRPTQVPLSPLRASLIGTVVADDPAWSMGMILDRTQSETGVYRIGDTLMAQAIIVEVLGQRVYLEREGRLEYLTLGEEDGSPFEAASPARASPVEDSPGIQRTGPNRWRIDRTELEKITSNLGSVAINVRIVPKIVEGEMQGFKLYAMRPGSIFSRLGFQNGDVIEKVNGYRLNSPEIMLELYKKLPQTRKVDIQVSRRGQPVTHDYRIE